MGWPKGVPRKPKPTPPEHSEPPVVWNYVVVRQLSCTCILASKVVIAKPGFTVGKDFMPCKDDLDSMIKEGYVKKVLASTPGQRPK